jgi:hypothetical protein
MWRSPRAPARPARRPRRRRAGRRPRRPGRRRRRRRREVEARALGGRQRGCGRRLRHGGRRHRGRARARPTGTTADRQSAAIQSGASGPQALNTRKRFRCCDRRQIVSALMRAGPLGTAARLPPPAPCAPRPRPPAARAMGAADGAGAGAADADAEPLALEAAAAKFGWDLAALRAPTPAAEAGGSVVALPPASIRRPLAAARPNSREKIDALKLSIAEIGLRGAGGAALRPLIGRSRGAAPPNHRKINSTPTNQPTARRPPRRADRRPRGSGGRTTASTAATASRRTPRRARRRSCAACGARTARRCAHT